MKSKAVVMNLRCALPKGSVTAQNPGRAFCVCAFTAVAVTVCERLENNR